MKRFLPIILVFCAIQSGFSQNQVGINTDDPQFTLDVRGTDPDDAGVFNLSNSDQSQRMIIFPGRSGDPNPFILWKSNAPMRFATDSSGFHEWMRITPEGNLGINDQNPQEKLSVAGNISISDTIKFDTVRTFYRYYSAGEFNVAKHLDEGLFTTHDYSWSNTESFYITGLTNDPTHFPLLFKTVDIPNGSRIKEIDVYYWDEDATNDLSLTLDVIQRSLTDEQGTLFCDSTMGVTSDGSLNQMRHLIHQETIANPMVIDKFNNTYSMYVTIYAYVASTQLRFYGVRLKYELDFFPFPD